MGEGWGFDMNFWAKIIPVVLTVLSYINFFSFFLEGGGLNLNFCRVSVALSPGPSPAFQCCMLKNGRAWYTNHVCGLVRHSGESMGEAKFRRENLIA